MPQLDTRLHLDMYEGGKKSRSLIGRFGRAWRALTAKNNVYGVEWGDPETLAPLTYMRDHYLLPYVTPHSTIVEIGVGGGRWTRYMLKAKQIYAVDYHQEILDLLKANFPKPNIKFIKNSGDDFPGVPPHSVDLIFSFGTFVHLELNIIDGYLRNMKPLLKPTSTVVIQYSDRTKPLGNTEGFADNDPDRMRELVKKHGFEVVEEDLKTIWHSSVIRFKLPG
jgi:SAM-dependent methyltransferase